MKPSEAVRLAAKLKAAYPRDVNSDTAALYAEMLGDLDADDAEHAVLTAISTLKFFPAVAELREIAARRRSNLPTASDAWGEVMRAFGAVGRYQSPKFSHPAIERVVDAMGWKTLCASDNVEATRAHFLRMYGETAARVVHEVNVRPLLDAAGERKRLARTGGVTPIAALLVGGKAS